jgi:hypothetical protein
VNLSPSLAWSVHLCREVNSRQAVFSDAPIDWKIKSQMICDLLNLCSLPVNDPSNQANKQRRQKHGSNNPAEQQKRVRRGPMPMPCRRRHAMHISSVDRSQRATRSCRRWPTAVSRRASFPFIGRCRQTSPSWVDREVHRSRTRATRTWASRQKKRESCERSKRRTDNEAASSVSFPRRTRSSSSRAFSNSAPRLSTRCFISVSIRRAGQRTRSIVNGHRINRLDVRRCRVRSNSRRRITRISRQPSKTCRSK